MKCWYEIFASAQDGLRAILREPTGQGLLTLWGMGLLRFTPKACPGIQFMRGPDEMSEAEERYRKIIWWNDHMARMENPESKGYASVAERQRAVEIARSVEKEIGMDDLDLGAVEYGVALGKLDTVRWISGHDWGCVIPMRGPC